MRLIETTSLKNIIKLGMKDIGIKKSHIDSFQMLEQVDISVSKPSAYIWVAD